MERREFLRALGFAGAAGGLSALGCVDREESQATAARAGGEPGAMAPSMQSAPAAGAIAAAPEPEPSRAVGTESRRAWSELMALLVSADTRYLGAEWGVEQPADIADGHRFLMHVLHSGIEQWLEADPLRPRAVRFVSPTLKLLGDNPDAVYYTAPLDPRRRYVMRGNTGGAVYTSLTIEGGNAEGHYPKRVAGTMNDTEFDVAPDGSFEIRLGPGELGRNRLALESDAGTVTTRHYFENRGSAAADPNLGVHVSVEPLEDPGPPPTPDDRRIAAGIRRVANYFRGATLGQPKPGEQPDLSWVSRVPNRFNPPAKWDRGAGGFGAVDNAYAMAPYLVKPGEALVIEGRWPEARFGSVLLWNRFMQTYDYVNRRVSLNRRQTQLEPDDSFRIVIAHQDPGVPNWIDAEGRVSGLVFWRFLLPEGEIETPRATLVPLDEVRSVRT